MLFPLGDTLSPSYMNYSDKKTEVKQGTGESDLNELSIGGALVWRE